MISPCIAVPLKKGEDVRKELLEKGNLRKDLILERDEKFLYLPIIKEQNEGEYSDYMIMEREFQVFEREKKSYKEFLDLPEDLIDLLPTSFDVIGHIAIVKLHDDLFHYKKSIGDALLKANKTLKTIANDLGVEGKERIRNLEIIAGEQRTETIHREHGVELVTDPFEVYFSPRLATERLRVSQMAKEGEIIVDMFCGIGPFSILIAKVSNVEKIYAIDINERAIEYLKRNIEKNKVENIVPIHGDSRDIIPTLETADRIIMNLPHSAFEFLSLTFSRINNNGVVHFYEVLENEQKERRFDDILRRGMDNNIELMNLIKVHTYSPGSSLYCFDLKVE